MSYQLISNDEAKNEAKTCLTTVLLAAGDDTAYVLKEH